jgi:ElaB/YqjD/DUF883 family membrane-anchored ribosome-binding protein
MSAAPEPVEPGAPPGAPEISAAARLARQRLHEEIERVRNGVEEMLDNQAKSAGIAAEYEELRRELDGLRLETRNYVKRKVRKSEKKVERSIREIGSRTDELELRIEEVAADRGEAEWRIHNQTEQMLDGLLRDVRSIADRLAGQPTLGRPDI